MGLSSSSPMQGIALHPHCRGSNIFMNSCHHQAERVQSFHDGLVFSNRPLLPKEKIWIKVLETERRWHGALRLGLTCFNPNNMVHDILPPFACPNLTCFPGFWAIGIPEELCREGAELCFWMNTKGQAFYRVKGQLQDQMLFTGLPRKKQLWVMLDVYGQTKSIQLLDPLTRCQEPPYSCHQSKAPQEMGRRSNAMPTSSGETTEPIQSRDRCMEMEGRSNVMPTSSGETTVPIQSRDRCMQETTQLDLHTEALNLCVFREDEPSCVICQDRLADTLLLPCRHCSFCKQCAQQIKRQSNSCPLCRQSIQSMRDIEEITRLLPQRR